jgi:uncharacterized protein YeaO (DUF488 family)
MAVRIVRLGTPRLRGEGLRIGTVRRPPRGVPRAEYARRDFYDVWLPELAPAAETVSMALAGGSWPAFVKRYRRELREPAARRQLLLLAALSRTADFSVGCYCEDEERCHRSVLRDLLRDAGAVVA